MWVPVRDEDGKADGWMSWSVSPVVLGKSVDFVLYVRRNRERQIGRGII